MPEEEALKLKITLAAACAATLLAAAGGATAAQDMPVPTDILFDRPHLAKVEAGQTLTYNLVRKTVQPELVGKGYDDQIKVMVKAIDERGGRDVTVDMFTGDRRRDPHEITGMTGNPILVFFLDRAVANYSAVAGGQRPYLKNRFKIALRETAKIEPVKVRYKGEEHDGYKVSITPYAGDLNKAKMRGFEGSTFQIVLSEGVPGHFVKFVSDVMSAQDLTPAIHEVTTLEGAEVVK